MSEITSIRIPAASQAETLRLYRIFAVACIRADFLANKAARALSGRWEWRAIMAAQKSRDASKAHKKAKAALWDFIHQAVPDTLHGGWKFDEDILAVSPMETPSFFPFRQPS